MRDHKNPDISVITPTIYYAFHIVTRSIMREKILTCSFHNFVDELDFN